MQPQGTELGDRKGEKRKKLGRKLTEEDGKKRKVWQPKEVHHRDFLLLFLLLVLFLLNISVSDRLIFIPKHLPSLFIAADLLNAFPLQISLFYLLKQAICSSPALQDWVGLMLLHKHWKGGLQRLRGFFPIKSFKCTKSGVSCMNNYILAYVRI